ncbi:MULTISPECIES: helix-turn-helix domain-containing protein [Luteimonas]|uniref:helix-turn-helix domain-containing protein n=1 Tax=Luteimonas TaxID=83614 RepID=UPI00117D019C|nr:MULTISPECIES: helix-turn-helix transcriptional regulator [Luteimonas]
MTSGSLGTRLKAALERAGRKPVDVARAAGTTEATIHNWINDKVVVEHVKAKMLWKIAQAAQIEPFELLLGEPAKVTHLHESKAGYAPSQDLQRDVLTLAFQLVEEALQGRTQTPEKRAEMVQICHELLVEGLPRATVLRLARAVA